MKKICFVDFDMSVTGGVEQVTASLANELCGMYETFVYAVNKGGESAYKPVSYTHLDVYKRQV